MNKPTQTPTAFDAELAAIVKEMDWLHDWTQEAVDDNQAAQADRMKFVNGKREQAVKRIKQAFSQQISKLQKYTLFEGDEDQLVTLDDINDALYGTTNEESEK